MPYDRHNASDREKVSKRLRKHWEHGVPDRAVDQFIEVFNGVHEATQDEGRALGAAYGTVRRRVGEDAGHAAMPAAVATLGRTLAVALSLGALRKLEQVLSDCDCGKEHARAMQAVRFAIRLALFKFDKRESKLTHAGMSASGYERRKAGVNVAWAWDMAAKQIYSQGDRVFLAVREMLQNSRDARATSIQIEWEPNPPSSTGEKTGTLTFTDNGKGMDQNTVETKFMELGGTLKEDGALGGFGAAKAAILTASVNGWEWDLRTRNVHARSERGGDYVITQTPDTFNGTKITLYNVKNGYMQSPIGSGEPEARIIALMATSDLRGIMVTVNGKQVEPYFAGRRGQQEKNFEEFDWGRFPVNIKSYKRSSGQDGAIIVRVKGLAQFAEPQPYGQKFKRDYLVDFEIPSDIVPQSDEYPFKAGRDSFRYGGPARESFDKLVDIVTAKSGEKTELSEYEEIAPDSTDPRERKAEAQFAKTLESVMSTKGFSELLGNLSETAEEAMDEFRAAFSGGELQGVQEGDASPRPWGGAEHERSPFDALVSLVETAATPAEQVKVLAEWARQRLANEDVYAFNTAGYYLEAGNGNASDLERFTEGIQAAIKQASPATSPLVVASFVARVIDALTDQMASSVEKEEVQKKKRKGELNPFGGAAVIFFSRGNYGEERAIQFRKDARKYMKHLVWWDFTVRLITQALHAGMMSSSVKPGVGFVLDDNVLGLCRAGGGFVMINPEPLTRVIEQFKDRPFIPASYIHGVACHEIAHAEQMLVNNNANHNEYWSSKREHFAEATLWLLPVIEDIGAKLFKMKRRRRRKEPEADSQALDKITKLETALAEARQRETELTTDVSYWKAAWNDERDRVSTARQDAYKSAREDARTEAESELEPFRVNLNNLAARLEDMLRLEEFRQWVKANPSLLTEQGITPEDFDNLVASPDGLYEMLRRAKLDHARMATDPTLYPELQEAYHAACGCVQAWSVPYHEKERDEDMKHAACPGCGGTCGGKKKSEHAACGCTRSTHAAARIKCPPTTRQRVTVGADGRVYHKDGSTSGPTKRRTPAQEKKWDRIAESAEDLLRKHKIKLGKLLGCGSYACAYEIVGKKSLVAKLTGDPADAGAWMQVIKKSKRTAWPKGLVRTHCVEAMPAIGGRQFFFMIQDKVSTPIRDYTAGAAFINDDEVREAFLEGDTKYLVATAKEFGADPKWVKPLADTIRWLKDNDIDWHDLHSGNVMLKGSVPVIIDLGHGTVPKAKVPVMKHAAMGGRSGPRLLVLDEDEDVWAPHRVGQASPGRRKTPNVDPAASDLDGIAHPTRESVFEAYATTPGLYDVYTSFMPLSQLSPRLVEVEEYELALREHRAELRSISDDEEYEQAKQEFEEQYPEGPSGLYNWEEFSTGRKPFPAPKVRVKVDGTVEILDGNHRIHFFQEQGFPVAEVWVVQELPEGRPGPKHAAAGRINGCPATNGEVMVEGSGVVALPSGKTSARVGRNSGLWKETLAQARVQLAHHGIELGEQLGCGDHACAFEAEGAQLGVVKITGDGSEAATWQRVQEWGRHDWPEGLAWTPCAEALELSDGLPPMFMIVQQQLEPLYADDQFLIDQGLVLAVEAYWSKKGRAGAQQVLMDWIRRLPSDIVLGDGDGDDEDELEEAQVALYDRLMPILNAVDWLAIRGIKWTDMHSGNVMMDSAGDFKIVDLGYSTVPLTAVPLLAAPPTTEHAALRLTGAAPFQDHIAVYTGEELQQVIDSAEPAGLIDQADTLIADSEWPGFDQILALAVDESTTDEDGEPIGPEGYRVVGVISDDGSGELLFLVDEEYQGQRIGRLMVQALLPEVDEATEEEVLNGDWSPPYHAIAGSEAGASFLHSLPQHFGWKAFALIGWSGYDDELEGWRESRGGHSASRIDVLQDMARKHLGKVRGATPEQAWAELHPNFREAIEVEARQKGVQPLTIVRQLTHAKSAVGGLSGYPREDRVEGKNEWYEGFSEQDDEDNDNLIADLLGG